ncbi:MAG TPA: aminotransferase class I/II-fold pyridoxal phosphate-dependent enzyme [bacterium]|nr:aminotransferase class I/II-fold pyridoxal phosphate-dependent enzyme [bacterium]
MEHAERIKRLPPYVFAEISRKKKEAMAAGKKLIDLGIGDPDRPTPPRILEFIKEASDNAENHRYPIGAGSRVFREAAAGWMAKRFDARLEDDEIVALIGAKDGITHLPLAYVNPGDVVLIPDPGYPGYIAGTIMAGGEPYMMPLSKENGFLPDLDAIPADIYKRAKIMWLNYPNNPTSAMADFTFYEDAVSRAKKYDFLIAQDAPYSEIYFREAPISMLEIQDAKKHVIEFYSMSKTYNMTGWRVGFAAGSKEAVNSLLTVKENMDSGTVSALQAASARALLECDKEAADIRALYKKRAEAGFDALKAAGYSPLEAKATMYLWVDVPAGFKSMNFCARALDEAEVVITPGIGFGPSGDGYFRIALTVEEEIMLEAISRLKGIKI